MVIQLGAASLGLVTEVGLHPAHTAHEIHIEQRIKKKHVSLVAESALKASREFRECTHELIRSTPQFTDGVVILTGLIGAVITTARDGVEAAERGAELYKLTTLLNELDENEFAHQIVEAQQNYAKKMLAVKGVSLLVDGLTIAAMSGVPIGALPISILHLAYFGLSIAYEKSAADKLKKTLQGIVEEYEKQNSKIIQDKPGFKAEHQTLKAEFEQAKAEKERTAAALIKATEAYRKGYLSGGSLQKQQAAQKADVEAEQALQVIEVRSKAWEKANVDFEAYEAAKDLILELDPLLMRQRLLEDQVETFEMAFEKTHSGAFKPRAHDREEASAHEVENEVIQGGKFRPYETQKYGRMHCQGRVQKIENELNKKLETYERDLAKTTDELQDINRDLDKANSPELDGIRFFKEDFFETLYEQDIYIQSKEGQEEYSAFVEVRTAHITRLERRQSWLEMDKLHVNVEIGKIKSEIQAINSYKKNCADLIKVKETIMHNKEAERAKKEKEAAEKLRKKRQEMEKHPSLFESTRMERPSHLSMVRHPSIQIYQSTSSLIVPQPEMDEQVALETPPNPSSTETPSSSISETPVAQIESSSPAFSQKSESTDSPSSNVSHLPSSPYFAIPKHTPNIYNVW